MSRSKTIDRNSKGKKAPAKNPSPASSTRSRVSHARKAEAPRTIRMLALGDALLAPPLYRRHDQQTPVAAYHANSPILWLRTILPHVDINDAAIYAKPGETTVSLRDFLAANPHVFAGFDSALISVGLQDSFRTMTGTAPAADKTVSALEEIAATLIASSVRPVFIVPPPCPQFENGLFADRYLAVSATLRRLARQNKQISLIDATDRLKDPEAFNLVPRDGVALGGDHGLLTAAGAILLSQIAATVIEHAFSLPPYVPNGQALASEALNSNPQLKGKGGALNGTFALGKVPDFYTLDSQHGGGLRAFSSSGQRKDADAPCRISVHGRYSSDYPFIRLMHTLPADNVSRLKVGDNIEAVAEFTVAAERRNLAAIQIQLVPVWSTGYIGLRSLEFTGQTLAEFLDHGVVRTPPFAIPAPLDKLSVSLVLYFKPGKNIEADATIDLHSVVVRKSQ